MSESLERVIAEQQREIDSLKKREETNVKSWIKQGKKYEDLARAAIDVYGNSSRENMLNLRDLLTSQGWCLMCEESPCECDRQHD